jgi:hypothetical protein
LGERGASRSDAKQRSRLAGGCRSGWHTPQPRQISRTSLIMLVLACVLPGVALCSYLLYANYQLEKKRWSSRPSCWPARSWSNWIANWPSSNPACMCWPPRNMLQNGDLQRFHKIASAALQSQTIYNYVLTDRDGRQVVNTLRPFGKPCRKAAARRCWPRCSPPAGPY